MEECKRIAGVCPEQSQRQVELEDVRKQRPDHHKAQVLRPPNKGHLSARGEQTIKTNATAQCAASTCPSTTSAQCTSCSTSTCCSPCPTACPTECPTACPTVCPTTVPTTTCCVVTTTTCLSL